MNLTSLITLPARLGYEVARRTIDLAFGAGRMVGLFRDDAGEAPPAPTREARSSASRRRRPEASQRRRPERAAPERRKPARPKPARARAASRAGTSRGGGAQRKRAGASPRAARGAGRPSAGAGRPSAPAESGPAATPSARAEPGRAATPSAPAEPSPTALADAGAGRQPAPFGSRASGAVESEDVTLIRRVEVEVLRDIEAPEIALDVNPIGGVVRLSGRASGADQVRELQRRALAVPGVKRVDNELQVPDEPEPRRFEASREDADAEPLPSDLADRGEGRQRAPLGASDDAPGGGGDARTTIP